MLFVVNKILVSFGDVAVVIVVAVDIFWALCQNLLKILLLSLRLIALISSCLVSFFLDGETNLLEAWPCSRGLKLSSRVLFACMHVLAKT